MTHKIRLFMALSLGVLTLAAAGTAHAWTEVYTYITVQTLKDAGGYCAGNYCYLNGVYYCQAGRCFPVHS